MTCYSECVFNIKMKIILALVTVFQVLPDVTSQTSNQHIYDFKTADFSNIVKTKYLVDKSMLIKDFFDDTTGVLATAPRRFGKSVNIDMSKRFFEIEVDDDGNEKINKADTANYKLFTNLKIYKNHRQFFNEHFGKYAVIHIDYSPLNTVESYEDMFQKFRDVLNQTFRQHEYLKNVKNLWSGPVNLTTFTKYTDTRLVNATDVADIVEGLPYLAHLLHAHFKKPVIVLIDEYNAFVDSPLFGSIKDMDAIITFIRSITCELLKYTDSHITKIFITGILRITGKSLSPLEADVKHYPFLRNHKYCQYYGITGDELEELLVRRTNNNQTEINNLRSDINSYYKAYKVLGQKTEIYSIWSILHYLETKILKRYWAQAEYLRRFFSRRDFKEEIRQLLQNGAVIINISTALSTDDILTLKRIYDSPESDASGDVYQPFFQFLFELGYLSKQDVPMNDEEKHLIVELPNSEIKRELTFTLY